MPGSSPVLRFVVLLVALLPASCGCGGPVKVEPSPEPQANVPKGRVEHEFLAREGRQETLLAENQEYKPPTIKSAPLPEYPEDALQVEALPRVIVVKILIDTDGRVSEILDSPYQPVGGDGAEASFRRAVEEALRRWRFTPAAICTYDPGADLDGDGEPDYRIERSHVPIRVRYDVRFRFEIVDGKGTVLRGGK